MWIYVLCIIVVIICLFGLWRKKQPTKNKVHPDRNSYNEYIHLTNSEIRLSSKSDKPDQKILLILKPKSLSN